MRATDHQQAKNTKPHARGEAEAWPEPRPLSAALAEVCPFDPELLPETLRPWILENGTAAPMYYALPNYVFFQVPWETDISAGSATLVVTRNGVASAPLQFPVGTFSPGIFTTTADGKGLAWAIFAAPSKINPNGSVAQASSIGKCPGPAPACYLGVPATVGDTLYIYAGGLGPVGPKTAADGHAPCPLVGACTGYNATDYSTTTKPTVTVGGIPATVTFSGLHPVYPGLYLGRTPAAAITSSIDAAIEASSVFSVASRG